jgi:hypothetical protein
MGKGKQQVLVEVLGEKKGPLLAAGRARRNPRHEKGRKYSWRHSGFEHRMRATPCQLPRREYTPLPLEG